MFLRLTLKKKKKKKNPIDYFQYVIAFNDFCFMNKRAVYDKALLLLLNHWFDVLVTFLFLNLFAKIFLKNVLVVTGPFKGTNTALKTPSLF